MTRQEIINKLHMLNVAPSVYVPIDELAQKWTGRAELLVVAAFHILGTIREKIQDVELRTRCNGVSGYGRSRANGRFRECFHVGINVRPSAMILCRHGEAPDPKKLFKIVPPNGKYVYCYLLEAELNQLQYAATGLIQSYRNIIGH